MLHQDDLWLPRRGAAVRHWLSSARSDAVMHLHPAFIINERGRKLGTWRCPLPAGEAPVPPQILAERLLVQNFIPIPSPTIRREAFLRVGGLDEALWYTADWDLYLKLSYAGRVWYHPESLACFRVHKNSLTILGSRSLDDFREQHELVRDRHAGKADALRPNPTILRLAVASIDINTALAAANSGKPGALIKALATLLKLGPRRIRRYFYYSRIIDRMIPRLRARLAGGL